MSLPSARTHIDSQVAPVRVAFISSYPPVECGIATYTQRLRVGFHGCDLEHFVLCHEGGRGERVFPAIAPNSTDFGPNVFDLSLQLTPDVIHIQHEYGLFGPLEGVAIVDLLVRFRIAGIPVVTTLHTVGSDASHEQLLVLQQLIEHSTHLIVHEDHQRQWLAEIFGEDLLEKTSVIHHGVREIEIPKNAKRTLRLEGKPVILLCGFVRPSKGYHRIVRLFPEINQQVPDCTLVVAVKARRQTDYPEYRRELRQLIEESDARNAIRVMQGQFSESLLDTLIGASDIVALPYEYGTQSGLLADAFAAQTPVVVSDLPGFVAVLKRSKGGLAAKTDADYIRACAQLLGDKSFHKQCREGIRRYVREVAGWSTVARRHLDLYRQLTREW